MCSQRVCKARCYNGTVSWAADATIICAGGAPHSRARRLNQSSGVVEARTTRQLAMFRPFIGECSAVRPRSGRRPHQARSLQAVQHMSSTYSASYCRSAEPARSKVQKRRKTRSLSCSSHAMRRRPACRPSGRCSPAEPPRARRCPRPTSLHLGAQSNTLRRESRKKLCAGYASNVQFGQNACDGATARGGAAPQLRTSVQNCPVISCARAAPGLQACEAHIAPPTRGSCVRNKVLRHAAAHLCTSAVGRRQLWALRRVRSGKPSAHLSLHQRGRRQHEIRLSTQYSIGISAHGAQPVSRAARPVIGGRICFPAPAARAPIQHARRLRAAPSCPTRQAARRGVACGRS